jgi:DNA (cytosine-5)-methyltransferase 1
LVQEWARFGDDRNARGVADSSSTRLEGRDAREMGIERPTSQRGSGTSALADDDAARLGEQWGGGLLDGERPAQWDDADGCGAARFVGHSDDNGSGWNPGAVLSAQGGAQWRVRGVVNGVEPASATSHWSGAEWIACRDGKARPIEPGTFPLAHGATARVGRLRAYGNAIVAPLAAEWIRATL